MKMIKQYKGGSYGNYSKFRCNDGEEKNECDRVISKTWNNFSKPINIKKQ